MKQQRIQDRLVPHSMLQIPHQQISLCCLNGQVHLQRAFLKILQCKVVMELILVTLYCILMLLMKVTSGLSGRWIHFSTTSPTLSKSIQRTKTITRKIATPSTHYMLAVLPRHSLPYL